MNEFRKNGDMFHGVFENSGLEEIFLPTKLSLIAYRAFRGCKNLRNVVLPDSLTCVSE